MMRKNLQNIIEILNNTKKSISKINEIENLENNQLFES